VVRGRPVPVLRGANLWITLWITQRYGERRTPYWPREYRERQSPNRAEYGVRHVRSTGNGCPL
jgi:hypothetical protein